MPFRVLHILDITTSADAVAALASFLDAEFHRTSETAHELVVLGHRSTADMLPVAGIPTATMPVACLPSMGWADPTGWRALRRLIDPHHPTLLHAWGILAAMACAMGGDSAARLITLTHLPDATSPRLLAAIDRAQLGSPRWHWPRGNPRPLQWVGLNAQVTDALLRRGIEPLRVAHLPLGVPSTHPPPGERQRVRELLGLLPPDGPVFLLAGDASGRSRHDHGLWAVGILQQIYPRARVIVRQDLRNRHNHGFERLVDNLADPEMPILAPAELSWESLLSAADVLIVSADGPVEVGAVLHAMVAGVPVIGTPIPAVRAIIDDGRTGLIAASLKPRDISARVEELLSDVSLKCALVAAARGEVASRHSPVAMVEGFRALYSFEGAASRS